MIQSCGFVTDKARNLPDSAFGSYHKQKIAKLQSYIIARRKLDLCSGDAGYAIHPPGEVENAILLIHGTTHTGKQFLAKDFRDAMFGPGQPLDAASTTLSYYQT
jgi:hypothetical protein